MINPLPNYLQPEDDGLPVRSSNKYALYKLHALQVLIEMTNTAMRNLNWRDRYYIDLQAGPGKNRIDSSIELGSPLIALSAKYPFTQYRFNELDPALNAALSRRVSASPLSSTVKVYQADANEIVHSICDEIEANDKRPLSRWSTLNLAFLDPEGLGLHWDTVKRLAQVKRMDLLINFSTGGLNRNARKMLSVESDTAIDRFFGTREWRNLYIPSASATENRRRWIDFYLSRLKEFGYHIEENPERLGGHDIPFRNSRNVQVYSLVYASKHPLGTKFWKEASKDPTQTRLFDDW